MTIISMIHYGRQAVEQTSTRAVRAHKDTAEEERKDEGEEERDSERREDSRFSGLYLAYKTDNSVNIPYSSAFGRVHGVKA